MYIYRYKRYNMHKKTKCEICGKYIANCGYKNHILSHQNLKKKHSNLKIKEEWKTDDGKYKCPFCSKVFCKKGIATHIWRMHTREGRKHNSDGNAKRQKNGYIPWSRGLTKETDNRVCWGETLKKRYATGELVPGFKGKEHTKETKEKISKKLSINNKGGRCEWYSYKKPNGDVVKVQGTWELRFAKLCDKVNIKWEKNQKYIYTYKDNENKKHYYRPDFYLPEISIWIEIKGYWWGKDKEKMQLIFEQNKENKIKIIRKKQLENLELLVKNCVKKENIFEYIKNNSFKI